MKRKYIPIVLIVSSFFLFACGLTNFFIGNDNSSANTQEEVAAPTESTEATDTTSEPSEETAQPTPTQEIRAQAQVDTTNPCYHPYFPIRDGAYWTYDDDIDDGYTLTVEETGDDTFTMVQETEDEGAVFSVDWYCTEDGLLQGTFAQIDIFSESMDDGDPDLAFESLEWEGRTLPAPELMEVGYTWTSEYTMAGEFNLEGFPASSIVTVMIEYTIGAIEEVTVPAGTFPESYRVDSTGEIQISMDQDETTMPFSLADFNSSTWYVEGVGMVQTESEFGGFSNRVELLESSLLN